MIGRHYNPKTNTVSGTESDLPLEQKVRLKYEMQDAGIDADKVHDDKGLFASLRFAG